jgi:ParB family chromosome partitioning protein
MSDEQVVLIPVAQIRENRHQPRRVFDEGRLQELADSIRIHGLIQPIVLRPLAGGFELAIGERRLRAAILAGLVAVPAIVREMDDRELALVALVENLQREDLDVMEEVESYGRLLDEFGLTQEELGRRIGKSQSAIANKLRLRRLDPAVRERISREKLGERQARALLDLGDPAWQLRVIDAVVQKGLTVRETERLVAEIAEALAIGRPPLDPGGASRPRQVRRVVRDIRIFLNAFQQAVDALKESGFAAEMTREDVGDSLEIRVRIPKERARP